MSFLGQMKLPGLIGVGLILILASPSKGEQWNVTVTSPITATLGSDVTIPCTFTYPLNFHTDDVKVYWKKMTAEKCQTDDHDKNLNIFHPENKCLLEGYKKRTKLIGDVKRKNCTLLIRNITTNEDIYVRVTANESYSFKKDIVSIFVDDIFTNFETSTISETNTTVTTQNSSAPIYVAISVAVAALVIIIILGTGGIVFWKKRKRSRTLIRQQSGYYANFSRTSSNRTKRDVSCEKQGKDLSEPKVIDEPIYLNVEAPPEQMYDADNIYANVDYQK
ncbi:uncharacterized protein AB9X84_023201 isoform 1-T2 [Acanthopagrus schlegelii]